MTRFSGLLQGFGRSYKYAAGSMVSGIHTVINAALRNSRRQYEMMVGAKMRIEMRDGEEWLVVKGATSPSRWGVQGWRVNTSAHEREKVLIEMPLRHLAELVNDDNFVSYQLFPVVGEVEADGAGTPA